MKYETRKAFTLIELLVVIAVIAMLMAIIMPALGKAKLYAQKIVCRSNIRQQCLGVLLYSDAHDSKVPVNLTGTWLWDLGFWSTNQISEYAGFGNNEVFYCPANKVKQADDARFWQMSWVVNSPGDFGVTLPCLNPIPINEEGPAQIASEFRVMPMLYMFDRKQWNTTTNKYESVLPDTLASGMPAKWIDKISKLKGASGTLMIMDNVVSQSSTGYKNFFDITGGWTDTQFGEVDNSNHRSNQREPGYDGYEPDGANVGFVDGHVSWRDYTEMRYQTNLNNTSICFWW